MAVRRRRDENLRRLVMTVAEKLSLAEALEKIEKIEKRKAKKRQGHGQTAPGKNAGGKLPSASEGKTRDRIGESVGSTGGPGAIKSGHIVTRRSRCEQG